MLKQETRAGLYAAPNVCANTGWYKHSEEGEAAVISSIF